jgi:hypothetical protein
VLEVVEVVAAVRDEIGVSVVSQHHLDDVGADAEEDAVAYGLGRYVLVEALEKIQMEDVEHDPRHVNQ